MTFDPTKPILSKRRYSAVLREIWTLIDAQPGPPEEVRLDALLSQSLAYQERTCSANAPEPTATSLLIRQAVDTLFSDPEIQREQKETAAWMMRIRSTKGTEW